MTTPEALLAAGQPRAALDALQAQVRTRASDPKLRVFLFQLLCVLGQWDRAAKQLEVCGELDAANLAMVAVYRDAVQCEHVRAAVFAGRTTPIVLGPPAPWIAALVEALAADGRGEPELATRLRADAFDAAPATGGTLDGEPFEWIADGDGRLGPLLELVVEGRYQWAPFSSLATVTFEPPVDLRDLVWSPARLTLVNGAEVMALVPVRYPSSEVETDEACLLARRTDWIEAGADGYRGIGQRVLVTDAVERGLLEVRSLVLSTAASAPSSGSPSSSESSSAASPASPTSSASAA